MKKDLTRIILMRILNQQKKRTNKKGEHYGKRI